METTSLDKGIFSGDASGTREDIVALLTKAYWMEIETVMSYLAASSRASCASTSSRGRRK